MLHVASRRLIARVHEVQPLKKARFVPLMQFVCIERVVRRIALSEDEPVTPMPELHSALKMGAQTRDSCAVPDKKHRPIIRGSVETRIPAHPHWDRLA